jgi:hypothetical protein
MDKIVNIGLGMFKQKHQVLYSTSFRCACPKWSDILLLKVILFDRVQNTTGRKMASMHIDHTHHHSYFFSASQEFCLLKSPVFSDNSHSF